MQILFGSGPTGEPLDRSPHSDLHEIPSASMGATVSRVMTALLSSLEAKSRLYKNPALASLFMMNNTQ